MESSLHESKFWAVEAFGQQEGADLWTSAGRESVSATAEGHTPPVQILHEMLCHPEGKPLLLRALSATLASRDSGTNVAIVAADGEYAGRVDCVVSDKAPEGTDSTNTIVGVLLPAFGVRTARVKSPAVASAVAFAQEAAAHDARSLSSDSASLLDMADCMPGLSSMRDVTCNMDALERLVEANANSITQASVDELQRELADLGIESASDESGDARAEFGSLLEYEDLSTEGPVDM